MAGILFALSAVDRMHWRSTENTRDKRNRQRKCYREENSAHAKAYAKAYRAKNKDAIATYHLERRRRHGEQMRAASRQYAKDNSERCAAYTKQWRALNPEKALRQNRVAYSKRRLSVKANLENRVRSGLHRALENGSKAGRRTFDLVGYCLEDLMQHLERQFLEGMSWENMGEWHIDHAVPLRAFNYRSPEDYDFQARMGT